MKKRFVKITAGALAAAVMFGAMGIEAAASGAVSLPAGGVYLSMGKNTSLENLQTEQKNGTKIEPTLDISQLAELEAAAKEAARLEEENMLKNMVIAQVNRYVNVRSTPDENGEILGKLYDKSAGTFISEENGWYQIKSGNVTGYVKAEYCVTGDDALDLAKEVGTRIATVETTTLFVRKEATTESAVLGMVPDGDELLVLEETDGWAKVNIEEGDGWISKDYVSIVTEFVSAESREEEEARLAKEAEERRKAQEAAAKKVAQNNAANSSNNSGTSAAPSTNYTVGEGNELGVAVAQYALQFVGNPYVYGGTSLTNGADCSGFVMSVYANFGVSLPHSSGADRKQGYAVDGLENAQPGDLICYSGHVALYIGNGQIVHASSRKTGIKVSNANYKKILAIRRIF
ncbi:MAG: SH3 domain-containing protein [Lachnospiraceae bacterium]|nr:SH3 domain-containing protein [Lachnospiraceae bacterium]